MQRARAPIRAAAVAGTLLVLAGCGNGEDADATPTAPAPTDPAPTEPATTDPTPEADVTTPATPADTAGETYTVQSGDTLSGIARRFDTTVEAIVEANDLPDPDVIGVGDELVVPVGGGDG